SLPLSLPLLKGPRRADRKLFRKRLTHPENHVNFLTCEIRMAKLIAGPKTVPEEVMATLRAEPRPTTIRDIARLSGVSIATVSRVLNDRPDVSDDTREAVLEVVRRLGFSTNRSARALSAGRTGLVGVTLPIGQR